MGTFTKGQIIGCFMYIYVSGPWVDFSLMCIKQHFYAFTYSHFCTESLCIHFFSDSQVTLMFAADKCVFI